MRRLSVVLITALLATAPSALAASAPTTIPVESYATLLSQITASKGNPQRLVAATVDKAHHHVRATLANGTRPLVSYPPAEDRHLVDTLLHHHIPIIYAKAPVVHHVLRYVAAGVVVVLLLIGVGVWFYTRGRGEGRLDGDGDADSPAASSTQTSP